MQNRGQRASLEAVPVEQLANVSHRRGDVQMITVTKDKIDAVLSASGSLNSNFLTLMIGIAASIFISLKSGGIVEDWQRTFWVAFWFSLILVFFFGIGTIQNEIKKRNLRRELLPDATPNNASLESEN
jgi:hypothetical protein